MNRLGMNTMAGRVWQVVGCLVSAWLATAQLWAQVAETPQSTTVSIRGFDREDFRGQIRWQWAGQTAATWEMTGTNQYRDLPQFTLSPETKRVRINGQLQWNHYRQGPQSSAGSVFVPVVDLSTLMVPLFAQEVPWSQRMKGFWEAFERFQQQHFAGDEPLELAVEVNPPASKADLVAAELRLGFALPPEHRESLTQWGHWTIDDAGFLSVAQLDRASKQLESVWGSAANEFTDLPAVVQQLLERSVMLYVEAGDGYAALLYCAAREDMKRKAGFYWISQDSLSEPQRLEFDDGRARDYAATIRWLVSTQVLQRCEDRFADEWLVDFRPDAENRFEIDLNLEPQQPFRARLRRNWHAIK